MTRPTSTSRNIVKAKLAITENIDWFEYYGYTTNISELARIFGMPMATLRQRVRGGWPIDAALVAKTEERWNVRTAPMLAAQDWVSKEIEATLTKYFNPTKTSKKN